MAESLSESTSQAHQFRTDVARGEVRAWARHVLKGYSRMGASAGTGDLIYLDTGLITAFYEAWRTEEIPHPQRDLPMYEEKAASLRSLARFQQSPSCGT